MYVKEGKAMTFKDLRRNVEKTTADMAKELNISEITYKRYECSSRLPRLETFLKMAKSYDCSLEELKRVYKHHKTLNKYRK